MGKRPPSRCRDNPDYAKKVASTLVNNWKIAKEVAALGGAEFHAILQPVAAIGQPNIEYLTEGTDDNEGCDNWEGLINILDEYEITEKLLLTMRLN